MNIDCDENVLENPA